MSKVSAPLLSFDASGAIAKTQVYAQWKGRPYVRRYVKPANPNTTEQQVTRNLFRWLNDIFKFYPGSAVAAWNAYADSLRITDRNAFIKQNLGPMRGETDINNMVISPSAKSGLIAAAINLTAGTEQITVALTAPSLPTGWTIVAAFAAAIPQQDPNTDVDFSVTAGTDATDPYSIVLTGLTAAQAYLVGGWFQYQRPDGTFAYGQSLQALATPTA